MIKKISVSIFLLFSIVTFAQQATSSPYSFYGIGDIRFKGTVESRLMGGIGVFPDSIHINIQNPASYSSLRLTSFTLGGAFNSEKLNSAKGNEKAQRTTLDYMAVGIPLGKGGIGFGLIPYSSVGYRIKNKEQRIEGDDTITTSRKYQGSGGVNKVFIGFGYQINKNLSLGGDINYNFGKIETRNIVKVSTAQLGAQEKNSSELSGLTVNLGAMYQRKINNKLDFYSSFLFTPESSLKSKNSKIISSVIYSDNYDPVDQDFLDKIYATNSIKLPSKYKFGVGVGQNKKWMLGTELTFQQSSKFGDRSNDITNVTYKDAFKYSLGGYYIPNYTSYSNYFKKITYRAGFRYENTGMVINNQNIRDYAFTGGFGLPLGGTFSNINLGLEFGRKGTAKALLIEENYLNVLVSLSLNDKWFVKSKYN